jgi:hypothetical protein
MRRFSTAILLAGLCWAAGAGASPSFAGPDVTKPYYYLGAGRTLSPLDQQQLTVYRDQLQAQQRTQQLQLYQGGIGQGGVMGQGSVIGVPNPPGPLRPFANPAQTGSNLYQTQSELGRVNGLLNSSRTMQMLTVPPIMVVKPFKAP